MKTNLRTSPLIHRDRGLDHHRALNRLQPSQHRNYFCEVLIALETDNKKDMHELKITTSEDPFKHI